ncbi:MAG: hypothetical protein NTZ19_04085 [Bacteroidetes bacterium]|nr:hypothetical protein [Bacteroidota bacterium]
MRTSPSIKLKKETPEQTEARIQVITRKVAIGFIVVIQLAIIYKMLF